MATEPRTRKHECGREDCEVSRHIEVEGVPRVGLEVHMKTKIYLIGDPVVREKISTTARIIWKSIVYAFALIGLGNVLFFVWRVFAV